MNTLYEAAADTLITEVLANDLIHDATALFEQYEPVNDAVANDPDCENLYLIPAA
ncbi:MAG: hypothetical protein RIB46_02245 [Pseudomonadales bacterium]